MTYSRLAWAGRNLGSDIQCCRRFFINSQQSLKTNEYERDGASGLLSGRQWCDAIEEIGRQGYGASGLFTLGGKDTEPRVCLHWAARIQSLWFVDIGH